MSKLKTLGFIAVFGCFLAATAQFSFAHSPSGHSHSGASGSKSNLPSYANSWPYLRAENGIYGPTWAAPGPGSTFGFGGPVGGGFGGGGYGYGLGGYGYGLTDFGYYPQDVPYFNLFPPVYYGYADGAIAPKTTINSSWTGDTGQSAAAASAVPEPPRPAPVPLLIVNPYYSAGK